jgi:hypothetical protein
MSITLHRWVSVLIIGLSLVAALLVTAPAVGAQESSKNNACQIIGEVSGGAADGDCNPPAGRGIEGLIKMAVNLLSIVAGIIAVIMIIIAGLKYITSQGDAAQISSAKNALIYAVIGLMIASLAQVIVKFVLARAT